MRTRNPFLIASERHDGFRARAKKARPGMTAWAPCLVAHSDLSRDALARLQHSDVTGVLTLAADHGHDATGRIAVSLKRRIRTVQGIFSGRPLKLFF
jgi:hypothetical protein